MQVRPNAMKKKDWKIMEAVDGSKESMYALSWCISNLISNTTTTNNKLVLFYAKPTPLVCTTFDSAGYTFSGEVFAALEEYSKKLANSKMEKAEAVCRNLDCTKINMEKVGGCGDAKDVICNAVQKLKADILVMGSHDYGFFRRCHYLLFRVLIGSAKRAKCPVVIVKHP